MTTTEHIFILAGMHRSGTSMAASLLQSAGVHMGSRLMGASRGNLKGHFENMDFVEFHQKILREQNLHDGGWTGDHLLHIAAAHVQAAKNIIEQNRAAAHAQNAPAWGWKDPRTTLLLEDWHTLLPDAHFILIYRAPWEVFDSIARRAAVEDAHFQLDPAELLRVWLHYNRSAIGFARAHPDQSLLVSNDAVMADPAAFIALLNRRFSASLKAPAAGVVESKLLDRASSTSTLPQLVLHAFPEIRDTLDQLHSLSQMRCTALAPQEVQSLAESRDFGDSFRDWFALSRLGGRSRPADAPSVWQLDTDLAWHRKKVEDLTRELDAASQRAAAADHYHQKADTLERAAQRAGQFEAESQFYRQKVAELEGLAQRAAEVEHNLQKAATRRAGELTAELDFYKRKVGELEPLASRAGQLNADLDHFRQKAANLEAANLKLSESANQLEWFREKSTNLESQLKALEQIQNELRADRDRLLSTQHR